MALVADDKPTLAEAQSFIPSLPFVTDEAMTVWLDNTFFNLQLEYPNATSTVDTQPLFKRGIAHAMMRDYYQDPSNRALNVAQQIAGSKGLGSDIRYYKDESEVNAVLPSEFHNTKHIDYFKAAGIISTSSSFFVGVQV